MAVGSDAVQSFYAPLYDGSCCNRVPDAEPLSDCSTSRSERPSHDDESEGESAWSEYDCALLTGEFNQSKTQIK